jgi:predicted component of type VI protein secretion system
MHVKLKVATGSHAGMEIAVGGEKFLIGRSDSCQLRPKSESVSRKHCILVIRDNRVLAQDLNSRNGTFVNENRLPSDKAKVLSHGDKLRVGKLEFEVVIEHGLQGPKKPKVQSVGEAAERAVQSSSSGSKFEAVDVTSWLDEADQIDRERKLSDPDNRQFRIEATTESEDTGTDGDDSSAEESRLEQLKKAQKAPPGKLPTQHATKSSTNDSRQAADKALKSFFSGR